MNSVEQLGGGFHWKMFLSRFWHSVFPAWHWSRRKEKSFGTCFFVIGQLVTFPHYFLE
jgi:hypothetical protein